MVKNYIVLIFLFFLTALTKAQEIKLSSHWTFRNLNESKTYPANIPGTIHGDLYRNKLIPDPYYSTNIDSVQWVEKEDWEYTCLFDYDMKYLDGFPVRIRFEGIDTYAQIYLNNKLIGAVNNMFRTWRFDITGLLK